MYPDDFFRGLLDNLYDGVYFVDRQRNITYWNSGAERITGFKATQVVGKSCHENILNHCDDQGCELCKAACPLVASMKTGEVQQAEVFLHHAHGHRVPVLVRVSPMFDPSGEIIGAVEIFSNNTAVVRARQQIDLLKQEVFLDPLTKLGNRRYFELQYATSQAQMKFENSQHGLLFMDIDLFKEINDRFGHTIGDQALAMVAETLRANLRDSDVIARWGGDEFVAILRDTPPEHLLDIAGKLRALVERSHLTVKSSSLRVTISIGVTRLRLEETMDEALRRADRLMYQSKTSGRNQVSWGE